MRIELVLPLSAAAMLAVAPQPAEAYIGPGAGITAIGTMIALVGAVVLAIVGFVWYPLKRLRARSRSRRKTGEKAAES